MWGLWVSLLLVGSGWGLDRARGRGDGGRFDEEVWRVPSFLSRINFVGGLPLICLGLPLGRHSVSYGGILFVFFEGLNSQPG